MLPTVLLGIMSLSNFGAANTIFSDFYPKVETVQVTQIPKKSFNFNLSGDEVTKLVNLDQEYPALQTINFNLNSDKGMWVKANLTGDFPTASVLSVKSNKADFTVLASGKLPKMSALNFVTLNGDTFVDWQAQSENAIDIRLSTRSGDAGLVLDNKVKSVTMSGRSGEMYVKWHVVEKDSSLKLNTSSGDIHVELENGIKTASIQSKSGDIDLQLNPKWQTNAEINLFTKTGDILLSLPKDVNVVLNTMTITGEIEAGELSATKLDSKTKVYTQQASANRPTITFNIETHTGDVVLH